MKDRHSVLLFLMTFVLAVSWLGTSPVGAQNNYPEKPITLIVTFPAGGPAEIAAKALAEASAKYLSQPITIKIVAGAGGT